MKSPLQKMFSDAPQRVDYNAVPAKAASGGSHKICKLAREWMNMRAQHSQNCARKNESRGS
jgi:hypothetical protein